MQGVRFRLGITREERKKCMREVDEKRVRETERDKQIDR